jgi:hypothetical protein
MYHPFGGIRSPCAQSRYSFYPTILRYVPLGITLTITYLIIHFKFLCNTVHTNFLVPVQEEALK